MNGVYCSALQIHKFFDHQIPQLIGASSFSVRERPRMNLVHLVSLFLFLASVVALLTGFPSLLRSFLVDNKLLAGPKNGAMNSSILADNDIFDPPPTVSARHSQIVPLSGYVLDAHRFALTAAAHLPYTLAPKAIYDVANGRDCVATAGRPGDGMVTYSVTQMPHVHECAKQFDQQPAHLGPSTKIRKAEKDKPLTVEQAVRESLNGLLAQDAAHCDAAVLSAIDAALAKKQQSAAEFKRLCDGKGDELAKNQSKKKGRGAAERDPSSKRKNLEYSETITDLSSPVRRPPRAPTSSWAAEEEDESVSVKKAEREGKVAHKKNNAAITPKQPPPQPKAEVKAEAADEHTTVRQFLLSHSTQTESAEVSAEDLLSFLRSLQDCGAAVVNPFVGLEKEASAVVQLLARPLDLDSCDGGAFKEQDTPDLKDEKVVSSSPSSLLTTHLLQLHVAAVILSHPSFKADSVDEVSTGSICDSLILLAESTSKQIKRLEKSFMERQGRASVSSRTLTLPLLTSAAAVPLLLPQTHVSALGRASRIIRALTAMTLNSEFSDELYEKLSVVSQLFLFLNVACGSSNTFLGATISSLCADSALLLHHAVWAWGVAAPQRSAWVEELIANLPWNSELHAGHCPLLESSCFNGPASASSPKKTDPGPMSDGLVCTLSVAAVLAVQAFPTVHPNSAISNTDPSLTQLITERLTSSGRAWVNALVSRCFAGGGDGSGVDAAVHAVLQEGSGKGKKVVSRSSAAAVAANTPPSEDLDVGHKLLLRVTEDWCAMIGTPQFPAADVLLKALIYCLTHQYIKAPAHAAVARHEAQLFEKNRAAAIDVFGRIALALHRFKDPKEILNVVTNETVLSEWCARMVASRARRESPVKKPAKPARGKAIKDKTTAEGVPQQPDPDGLSLLQRVQCSAFHGFNRRSQLSGEAGERALWYSARQVHVIMWANMAHSGPHHHSHHKQPPAATAIVPTKDAFDGLLQDGCQVLCPDVDDSSDTLKSLVVFASSYNRRSIVHPETTEAVLLGILSVFKTHPPSGEEHQASGPSSSATSESAVRKRAMAHVATLLDLFPALLKAAWNVAREGISDDGARVREASVSLLETIAIKCLRQDVGCDEHVPPSASKRPPPGNPDVSLISGSRTSPQVVEPKMREYMKELGHGALSALVHLIQGPSDAVVTRALVAIDTTLKAVVLDSPTTMYVLSRVLRLITSDTVGRYHTMIAKLLYDRWFCSGSKSESARDLLTIMAALERGKGGFSTTAESNPDSSLRGSVSSVQEVANLFGQRVDALHDDEDIPLNLLARSNVGPSASKRGSTKHSSHDSHFNAAASALKDTVYPTLDVEELLDEWTSLLHATSVPPYELSDEHPLVVVFSIIAAARVSGGPDQDGGEGGIRSLLAANAASSRKAFLVGGGQSAKAPTSRLAVRGVMASKKGFSTSEALVNARCALCCRMFLMASCQSQQQKGRYPGGDGGGAQMAMVSLLCSVDARWCAGLQEPLTQLVESATASTPLTDANNEASNVSIPQDAQEAALPVLHACRALRCIFEQVDSSIPNSRLLDSLGAVVLSYPGPFVGQVVGAAIAALSASIEVGRLPEGKLFNKVPLRHCYALLNRFFLQAAQCVPQLKTGNPNLPRAVGVLARTLYSIGEILKGYVWQRLAAGAIEAHLKGDNALTAPAPNRLCDGAGILANLFNLIKAVRQSSSGLSGAVGDAEDINVQFQGKVLSSLLRVVGALCLLVPTDYFRQCEGMIREGLTTAKDSPVAASVQLQALSILFDFLVDEERRVNIAAMSEALRQQQQHAANHSGCGGAAELILSNDDAVFGSAKNDLNSGMATWVLQQFHVHILALFCTSTSQQVREKAFAVVEVSLNQGLLAPSVYTEALMAGCVGGCVQGALRDKALSLVAGILEHHESAVIPKIPKALVRGYEAIAISLSEESSGGGGGGVDGSHGDKDSLATLLGCAVLVRETADGDQRPLDGKEVSPAMTESIGGRRKEAPSGSSLEGPVLSVGCGLYTLLATHKKRREQFIGGALRLMYQDARLSQFIREHVCYVVAVGEDTVSTTPPPFPTSTALAASETILIQLKGMVAAAFASARAEPSEVAAAPTRRGRPSSKQLEQPSPPLWTPPVMLGALSGGSFVAYLGLLVAFLPYQIEGEVTFLIDGIRSALDVVGQCAEDDMHRIIGGKTDGGSNSKGGNGDTSSHNLPPLEFGAHRYPGTNITEVPLAVCFPVGGMVELLTQLAKVQCVIILVAMKDYLRREHALSAAKMLRRQQQMQLSTTGETIDLGDAEENSDAGSDAGDGSMTGPPKPKKKTAKKKASPAVTGNARLPARHALSRHALEFIGRVSSVVTVNGEIERAIGAICKSQKLSTAARQPAEKSEGSSLKEPKKVVAEEEDGGYVSDWNSEVTPSSKGGVAASTGNKKSSSSSSANGNTATAASGFQTKAHAALASALQDLHRLLGEAMEEDLKDMMVGDGGESHATSTSALRSRGHATVGRGKRRRDDDNNSSSSSMSSDSSDEDGSSSAVEVHSAHGSSNDENNQHLAEEDDDVWEGNNAAKRGRKPAAKKTSPKKATKPPPKQKGTRSAKK